jgi:hypothetical protein
VGHLRNWPIRPKKQQGRKISGRNFPRSSRGSGCPGPRLGLPPLPRLSRIRISFLLRSASRMPYGHMGDSLELSSDAKTIPQRLFHPDDGARPRGLLGACGFLNSVACIMQRCLLVFSSRARVSVDFPTLTTIVDHSLTLG